MLTLLALPLAAQAPPAALSPEEELLALLNTPVTVASRKAMTSRESPGVVSVVTREEILAAGARDLIDVLALVPGFEMGVDVNGVTGPSMRGIWAYEGKILLLWDGVEMNDTIFGNIALGNHFPVDQIKRVEIIRGPGSVTYGGFAEVAVIQVTTLQAEDLNGAAAGVGYGRGQDGTLHTQVHALYGWKGEGSAFTIAAFGGGGDRSTQPYTDATGQTYSMKGNSAAEPFLVNLGVKAGGFQLRAIVDNYQMKQRDSFGVSLGHSVNERFVSHNLDLRYEFKLGEGFSLTPYAVYRDQKPFWMDAPDLGDVLNVWALREKAGVTAGWLPNKNLDLQLGYEFTRDRGTVNPRGTVLNTLVNGKDSITYDDHAVFAQAQYQGVVNLTLGARFEHHSEAGNAFVPRFALTKVVGQWHFKFLAAQSFRTPNIFNFNLPLTLGTAIQPEKTTSFELETGYQFGAGILSVNLFDMKVNKPLVFAALSATEQGYVNQGSVETKGFELQYQTRLTWGFVNVSYDYHRMDNQVPYWSVPGDDSQSLGLPNQSASLLVGIKLGQGWSLNPNLHYQGERSGNFFGGAAQGVILQKRSADLVLGGTLVYNRGPVTASLGVFDAGNRQVPFLQPYNGGHTPLPGTGRELMAKLKVGF
jgi:outer membrane cobalamin receptor